MTQPLPFLQLSDALDTITLMAGSTTPGDVTSNRRFWSPQIASLRPNQIGGQGAYQEVIEEFDLNISGSTVANAYANLERLNRLLDRAERWTRAEFVDATFGGVQLQYAPQGSTVSATATYLRAVVLGRAPGDTTRAPIELPPDFSDAGMTRYMLKVRMRVYRRGRWLLAGSASYSAGAAQQNGNVLSCAGIPAHDTMSPVYNLFLGSFDSSTNPTISAGIIAVGCLTSDVIRAELMSGCTAAGYTTQADAANKPRGGTNVLRYTPTGTAAARSGKTVSATSLSTSPVAIVAVVRNNHASRVFQMRVNLHGFGVTTSTPYLTIEAGSNQPQVIRLGIIRHPYLFDQVSITCSVDSTTGSPTLDVDAVYLVALHNQASRVIQHAAIDISGLSAGASADLGIRVEQDGRLTPGMAVEKSGSRAIATYYDPVDLEMIGTVYRVCWIATRSNYWIFTTTGGATVNLTAAVRRSQAWMGPQ